MDMATPKRYSELKAINFINFQIERGLFIKFTIRRCELLPPNDVLSIFNNKLLSSWKGSFYIFVLSRVNGNTNRTRFCHLIINSHLNRLTNVNIWG